MTLLQKRNSMVHMHPQCCGDPSLPLRFTGSGHGALVAAAQGARPCRRLPAET